MSDKEREGVRRSLEETNGLVMSSSAHICPIYLERGGVREREGGMGTKPSLFQMKYV